MLNLPGFILKHISPVISSILSYFSFLLMLIYFFIEKNKSTNVWMLILGISYFLIGSLSDQAYLVGDRDYYVAIIKYFIIIIGGYQVVKNTTNKELLIPLLIGAFTVFIQMFFFIDPYKDGGRYSGFYLNPNSLGFICMMGYALSFGVSKKWKLISQISFTFIGFITFSRTFLVVWLLINLLSIKISIKNIRVLAIGLGLFLALLTYNEFLPKKNVRLEAMSNLVTGNGKSNNSNALKKDSRTQTWAVYYPALFSKPFFGNGYLAFDGGAKVSTMGPHNAYIKTWGESGIIPISIMLIFYGVLIKKAWSKFEEYPSLFLMLVSFCLFISTNHSYWTNEYLLFFSMWLQYKIISDTTNLDSKLT